MIWIIRQKYIIFYALKKRVKISFLTIIQACNKDTDVVFSFIILKFYSRLIFVENLPDQNI